MFLKIKKSSLNPSIHQRRTSVIQLRPDQTNPGQSRIIVHAKTVLRTKRSLSEWKTWDESKENVISSDLTIVHNSEPIEQS